MAIPEADIQSTTVDAGKVNYEEQLPKVQKNINELRDDETKNDKEVKENLDKSLNANFLKGIKEFLDKQENGQRKSDLEESIKVVLYKHRKDENFNKEYESLISLATALGVEWDNDESADKNGKLKGEITINGSIGGNVDELGEGKTTTEHFYENGKKTENIPTWVGDFENTIEGKLSAISPLISEGGKFKDDVNLKSMEESLKKIQKILKNPTVLNVQLLQKYIYDNLNENEKKDFEDKNKYGKKTDKFDGKFDGKFGDSTKAGLETLLKKMDAYMEQLDSKDNNKNEGNVDSEVTQGGGDDVVEKVDDQSQQSLDTKPLTLGTNQHLVMSNSSTIAQNAGLNGATFYFGESYNGEHPAEGQSWNQAEIPANGQDYICYMKLSNRPSELYKVKVDKYGNLCPVATKTDSKLISKDGSSIEESVLFKNNPSCINYLINKLPDEIKNDCEIGWVDSKNDYTLRSYKRTLTIEPMTIAGDWVCKDNENNPNYLSKCLAFINLTNYIRSLGDNYGNKDPDINSDLKVKGVKINGKKVHINKEALGLKDATDEEISRFKKYNNHEDWRDIWDKKKPNRNYKKIDFPNVKVEGQVAVISQRRAPQLGSRGESEAVRQAAPQLKGSDNQNQTSNESIRGNEVTGFYLKPKEPIYGMENEGVKEGKTGGLGGIGAFDGKGNFKFDGDIKEVPEGEETIINVGNDKFTKIEYTNGNGMSIQEFSGKGYQICDNGKMKWFFIGEYDKENKTGKGKRVFENGAIYDGEWKEGLENGEGKYTYPNGDVYEGKFENGKFNGGEGTYIWKNGIQYTGEFKDDEMTKGKLIINSPDGQETSYEVENDGKGLKVSLDKEGNEGIYISAKKGNNETPTATSTGKPWSERAQEIAQKLKDMGFNAEVVEIKTT